MRVRDLHIEGFGRFADWRRGPFERPVTLFHGANEAGKSTLLEFIRRLLFGFPDGRSSSNPYPPLAGGRHGGRLTLVGKAAEIFVVQRFQGTRGGALQLNDANGKALVESELQRLLGHHSKAVFQSVFTFTLDDLHDDALLKDDQVNNHIIAASMGATKMPEAFGKLNDEKKALFLPGGRNHKIYHLAADLDPIAAQLNNANENAADYGRLSAELECIEAQIEELEINRQNNQSLLNQQKLLEQAWPDWSGLHEAERELSEVPAIDSFPADGVNRLNVLEDRMRTAQQECDSSEDAVAIANSQAEIAIEHESILDHADHISSLEQGLSSFANDIHNLPRCQAELRQQQNALTETLRELGPDWNEERLENFDLSLVVREEISRQASSLQEADQQLTGCRSTLAQDQRLLQEAIAAQQAAQNHLDAAPAPEIDLEGVGRRRMALRQMQFWLAEITSIEAQAANLQAQLDSIEMSKMPNKRRGGGLALSIVGFSFGLALLGGGAAMGGVALLIGMTAGVVLIGMAAYLFVSRRSLIQQQAESPLAAPIRESLRKAKDELQRIRSALAQEAEPFHLDVIDDAALHAAENLLNAAEAQLRERASRTETLRQATNSKEGRQGQEQQSREAVERAEAVLQSAKAEWRAWLAERCLPEDVSPATIGELRGKVDLGKAQLHALQNSRSGVDATRRGVDEYFADAEQLAVRFGLPIDRNDPHTAATAVRQLAQLRTEVDEQIGQRASAEEQLRDARRQLQRRQQSLREVAQEKQALLQSGGADDAEAFRQRAEQHGLRLELERRKRETLGRLQRLSGPGQPLEDLKQSLAETDMQTIQEQQQRLGQESQEISERINKLSEQRGATQEQLDQLTSEEESSKLRTERHWLLEDMRGHARAWAVRTVAENLLKEARAKFERERQPNVLRDAQEFFCNITDGRYETVFSPLGESEIRVKETNGEAKQPNQLSRGTREQLFLSLRFGLIRELNQRSEPQPIILDDALVNFDPNRGKKAAKAFLDLAETNQVLVFTCHPQIVEWFTAAAESKGVEPPEVIWL